MTNGGFRQALPDILVLIGYWCFDLSSVIVLERARRLSCLTNRFEAIAFRRLFFDHLRN